MRQTINAQYKITSKVKLYLKHVGTNNDVENLLYDLVLVGT